MKFNALVKKSALAVAVSAASVGSAFAATHTFQTATGLESYVNVLAEEVFGEGSEATAVAVPETVFTATENNTFIAGDQLTVKYTLDAGAVFSEDYSDIQKWKQAGTKLQFLIGGVTYEIDANGDTVDAAAPSTSLGQLITVDQGGAVNDNTVTFKIDTTTLSSDFTSATVGQFRVFKLKDALEPNSPVGEVRLGAEFRNVTQDITDTVEALVVLTSQPGIQLTSTATTSASRPAIDSANNLLNFTSDLGDAAFIDFDALGNGDTVNLGNLAVQRTVYALSNNVPATRRVRKENGDEFDFQGSDQINVNIATSTDLSAFGDLYLSQDNCATAEVQGTAGATGVSFNLQGQTTSALQTGYSVCFQADGGNQIPNFSVGQAQLDVDYFNPRYLESADTAGPFGELVRNGCEVTLFNVPNPNAQDQAFIRLSNISELPGPVSAFIYDEAGSQSQEVDLGITIPAHGTAILHTNQALADDVNRVYLPGAIAELGALTTGRARIVLNAAFPSCEALGLVRSPNGTLVNVTSTTYSGAVTQNALINRTANGTSNSSQ
jgi:hypothetical protein